MCAATFVGQGGHHFVTLVQLDRLVRNIVRQLPANDPDRHGSDGQVADRERNPGHLLRVRLSSRERGEKHQGPHDRHDMTDTASIHTRPYNSALPQPLQNRAS